MNRTDTVAKLNNALKWSTRFKNFLGTINYATGAVAVSSLMASMVFVFLKGQEKLDGKDYGVEHTGNHYGQYAGDLFAIAFLQRLVAGLVDGLIYGEGYTLRFSDLSKSLQGEVRGLINDDQEANITINDDDSVASIIEQLSGQRMDVAVEEDEDDLENKETNQTLAYGVPVVGALIVGVGTAGANIYNGETNDGSIKLMLGSALVITHQASFWALNRIRDAAFNVGANTATYLGNQWRSCGATNDTAVVASTVSSTNNNKVEIPMSTLSLNN